MYKIFFTIITFLVMTANVWGDQYTQLWQEGRLEQAIAALQKVSEQSPQDRMAQKRYQAMMMQKKSLDDMIRKSMDAMQNGAYQKAKKILAKAALINDRYPVYQKTVKQLVQKEAEVHNPLFTVPDSWIQPEMPDLKGMENFVDTAAITTAYNLLKQLYGKMTAEQEKILKKQFAQYYEYPCDEVTEYFKNLIPVLYKAVSLKTKLSAEMEGYGVAAADATNALNYKSEKMAEEASRRLLQRRKNILAIQRQLAEINMHGNTIGTPPNALEIKKKREKEFEALVRLAAQQMNLSGELKGNTSSLNGIWEIRDDDSVKEITISRRTHASPKRINAFATAQRKSKDIPHKDNQRLFMEPMEPDKIYFKEMADLEAGYHFFFYAGYHKKVKQWDAFGFLVMQKTGKSTYVTYSDDNDENLPWKMTFKVQDGKLLCHKDVFIQANDSMIGVYDFMFHHIDNSNTLPDIKFYPGMDWSYVERIVTKWTENYRKSSKKEKAIDFSLIKDKDESILLDLSRFRYNKSKYDQKKNASKKLLPTDIKKNNYVWKLTKTTVETYPLPLMSGYGAAFDIKTKYSIKEGWLKIWKEKLVDGPGSSFHTERTLLATYTWNAPGQQYNTDQIFNANPGGGGLPNATWDLVQPTMKSSKVAIQFINASLIDFKKQKNRLVKSSTIQMNTENLGSTGGRLQLVLKVKDEIGAIVQFNFSALPKNPNNALPNNDEITDDTAMNTSKEDFYNLQIEQLREDVNSYKERMTTATTKEQRHMFSLIIMGKEADLQQQKDLLAEIKTGQFKHTETKWDKYNASVSASRFVQESQKYQEKIKGAEYRVDMIRKIGEMSNRMIEQDELGVRNWAQKLKEKALKTNDTRQLSKIYTAMKKRYMQNLETDQIDSQMKVIDADDRLARAEGVKSWAEFGVMAGTMGATQGSLYLYAGYTGITNGISDGLASGVKHAISNLNMATMVAGSAYDGYNYVDPNTGKKRGLEGAAKNAGTTLAILGLCHLGIKAVTKTSSIAAKTYDKYAIESAMTAKEREMSIGMVKHYETKLQKLENLAKQGDRAAAKEYASAMQKETEKLMANPHAKNYFKYNGSEASKRMYLHYEKRVKARVASRFKKMMRKNGWEKFKLKEYRNAASGNSVGMDWDIGLIEDDLKTITINGKEVKMIMKNDKPMSIQQFQKEGEKMFRKAYKLETGYSAEGSFANLTTSANAEAFQDVAILKNPAMADKEMAGKTAWTVKYKAEHMMSKHSMGFVTKVGKLGEACRGLAKEIRTKLIPNLKQSQNKLYLNDRLVYMEQLQTTLQAFGENRITVVEAERSVRKLTGKSLNELPKYISESLRKAIKAK